MAKYQYNNTEYIEEKPAIVQKYWNTLSQMDPSGELFVNNHGVIVVDGEYPDDPDLDDRRPEALGIDEDMMEVIERYAVPDALEMDDDGKIIEDKVVGVLFTTYQMLEAIYHEAFAAGEDHAKSKLTDVLVSSASIDDIDEDEDDDDDFEDAVDVLSEDSDGYDYGDEQF